MPSPRHDHSDPTKEKFGKRTVAYEAGSKAYKIIVEEGTARKVPVDKRGNFGDAHPDAADFPNAKLLESETTKGDDNSKVFKETFKSLPGPSITTTRLDDDGNAVVVTRQRLATGSIVTSETLATGTWTRKWKGEGDLVAAEQITEARALAGNVIGPYGETLDYDGKAIFTAKTRVIGSAAAGGSVVVDGVWARTTHEPITELVMWEIIRTRTLPGDAVTTTKVNKETGQTYTEVRTLKDLSLITEGITKVDGTSTTVTESQPIDEFVGYELLTIFPQEDAHSEATAIDLGSEWKPFSFKGIIDVLLYQTSSGQLGYIPPYSRVIPHLKKAWWVISAGEPSYTPAADGRVSGAYIYSVLSGFQQFGELIIDGVTLHYSTITVVYPDSSPSRTVYLADWVNGDPRVVIVHVAQDGNKYRWKIETESIVFVVPEQPTWS